MPLDIGYDYETDFILTDLQGLRSVTTPGLPLLPSSSGLAQYSPEDIVGGAQQTQEWGQNIKEAPKQVQDKIEKEVKEKLEKQLTSYVPGAWGESAEALLSLDFKGKSPEEIALQVGNLSYQAAKAALYLVIIPVGPIPIPLGAIVDGVEALINIMPSAEDFSETKKTNEGIRAREKTANTVFADLMQADPFMLFEDGFKDISVRFINSYTTGLRRTKPWSDRKYSDIWVNAEITGGFGFVGGDRTEKRGLFHRLQKWLGKPGNKAYYDNLIAQQKEKFKRQIEEKLRASVAETANVFLIEFKKNPKLMKRGPQAYIEYIIRNPRMKGHDVTTLREVLYKDPNILKGMAKAYFEADPEVQRIVLGNMARAVKRGEELKVAQQKQQEDTHLIELYNKATVAFAEAIREKPELMKDGYGAYARIVTHKISLLQKYSLRFIDDFMARNFKALTLKYMEAHPDTKKWALGQQDKAKAFVIVVDMFNFFGEAYNKQPELWAQGGARAYIPAVTRWMGLKYDPTMVRNLANVHIEQVAQKYFEKNPKPAQRKAEEKVIVDAAQAVAQAPKKHPLEIFAEDIVVFFGKAHKAKPALWAQQGAKGYIPAVINLMSIKHNPAWVRVLVPQHIEKAAQKYFKKSRTTLGEVPQNTKKAKRVVKALSKKEKELGKIRERRTKVISKTIKEIPKLQKEIEQLHWQQQIEGDAKIAQKRQRQIEKKVDQKQRMGRTAVMANAMQKNVAAQEAVTKQIAFAVKAGQPVAAKVLTDIYDKLSHNAAALKSIRKNQVANWKRAR